MQVSRGEGGGEVKKSEEIPSWCLGTNSYTKGWGTKGWPPHAKEGGYPSSTGGANTAPSSLPGALPPQSRGPGGPGWPEPRAGESQRVAAHPGQRLPGPPPLPTRCPSLGLGPCPLLVGPAWAQPPGFGPSRAPRPAQKAQAPEPPTPAPTRSALTPRSRRDSEAADWALCCARSRRLPWCSAAAAAELGGGSGGGGWAWAPLEGGGGGGDGRGLGAGGGGGSGCAGGRESGAPSRDSRPVSWRRAAPLGLRRRGVPGEARRGEAAEQRRRGVRVNRGPLGRREDPALSAAPTAAPSQSDVPCGGAGKDLRPPPALA